MNRAIHQRCIKVAETMVHQTNQLGVTTLHPVIISNINLKEIIPHHQLKIDLDDSKLSPKGKERLFDIIFEQRGAMSLYGQIGNLKNFYFKIKMSSGFIIKRATI